MEHPNPIMDTAIRLSAKKANNDQIDSEVKEVIAMMKRYKGELLLTWHIYIREKELIIEYIKQAEEIVPYAVNG